MIMPCFRVSKVDDYWRSFHGLICVFVGHHIVELQQSSLHGESGTLKKKPTMGMYSALRENLRVFPLKE